MKKKEVGRLEKSQVSVFIIIGIVFVATIILMYIFFRGGGNLIPHSPFENSDISSAKDAITQCMKKESYSALKTIGLQGGYFNKPKYYYQLDWAFIPYYFYEGEIISPTNEKIQMELGAYVDSGFKKCLNEIKFRNIKISYDDSRTTCKIEKSKVTFTIDMPVSINRDNQAQVIELKNYPVSYNSTLNEMIEVASYITTTHADNPALMCVNCIIKMAEERKLYVDFINFPFENDTTLVMLSENKTMPEPYVFEFLNKYGTGAK